MEGTAAVSNSLSNSFAVQLFEEWVLNVKGLADIPWLLTGMVPAQGITLLTGRQKKEGQKSWLARLMALSMTTGRKFGLIDPPQSINVWYIDREGAPKLTLDAWEKLSRGMNIDFKETQGRLHYTHLGAFYLNNKEHVGRACEYIKKHTIKCVIIDTFAKSFQGDENDAQSTGKALQACSLIQQAGAAVVLVHHLRKGAFATKGDEPTPDEDIRGSGALAGGFDMHLAIRKYDGLGSAMWLLYGGKYVEWRAAKLRWTIGDDFVDGVTGEVYGAAALDMIAEEWPVIEQTEHEPKKGRF